ncbi:uncharacterized protein LOC110434923 isoform X2 [Sorghum bicolor]|uniref:uncharacterized protein LOC110434923 isoform X2 n=1 Tax=Sorghum bicolor TaxID=4558 RepID=UPI000B4248B8|nr:uncharacterized protein LOC110434923 isoform X2 [Sorghum bicolor]|eukprot:XP_021315607.1 uncharacterized protein LOC110434923 isoform X2 [Sorghum bicolor]
MLCAANHPRPPHSAAPFMSSSSRPPRPRPPRRSENAAPTSLSFTAPIIHRVKFSNFWVFYAESCKDFGKGKKKELATKDSFAYLLIFDCHREVSRRFSTGVRGLPTPPTPPHPPHHQR